MTDFTQQYIDLIIKQYFTQVNAVAEIDAIASTFETIKDVADEIADQFDLDIATGDMLDKIGLIVGLRRSEPEFNDDETYRLFIRIKIAQNTAKAVMVNDTGDSLQDVINFAFQGNAYVIDKKDMTLDIFVDESVDLSLIQLVFRLNLLPKPQGVRYNNIKIISDDPFFGLDTNANSRAFASKNDPAYVNGGPFARKIII